MGITFGWRLKGRSATITTITTTIAHWTLGRATAKLRGIYQTPVERGSLWFIITGRPLAGAFGMTLSPAVARPGVP